MSRHYFDHAATTPIDPRVLDCMEAVHRGAFGNPSSLHAEGRESRRHLEDARESVAADLGAAHASEVVFTGTATEANDLALCGLAARLPTGRTAILASPIEHPSVIETLEELEDQGHPVRWLSVSRTGRIDLSQAPEQLAADVGYSAMMWVNNETGVIQPIEEWAALCRDRGILTHCDAVQAAPRLPIDLSCVPIDTLTISAHKLNGPKGVGALFVRRETPMKPRLLGGGQERGRRAGTENVAGAVGLAKALRLAIEERQQRRAGQAALEQRLIET
ncbi:MAG: cysteine desulfurase, partial [Planctomycetes bacterium]|nr:cysteine desulfurase [Planctomycetota bacterium]